MYEPIVTSLAFAFPTAAEWITAIPVIISLIIIEGLLSVDNALAIAAMAKHLPGRQKYLALKYGIIGAYVFRGLCMWWAAWIIANPWLKIIGAGGLPHPFDGSSFSAIRKMRTGTMIPTAAGCSAAFG